MILGMQKSNFPILLLIMIFCIPCSLSAKNPNKWLIGGLIRSGPFSLAESATENVETSLIYDDRYVENFFGKLLIIEYSYSDFIIGGRWVHYRLEGESEQYDQFLDLDYTILTLGYIFLKGDFIHPRLDSRLGVTLGKGQSKTHLITKTSRTQTLETYNETYTTIKPTDFVELVFDTVTHSGWGYRMGYFAFFSGHSNYRNGTTISASSTPQIYITLIWRY